MRISVKTKGIKKAVARVKEWEKENILEIKKIIAETAYEIQSQAQALAPVDDGNLKNSIEVMFRRKGLVAEINVGANYGIYVEYGTGIYAEENGRKTPWVYWSDKLGRFVMTQGMRAQPYFRPAVEMGSKKFIDRMNRLA